jgi:pyruvate dehydrogenase E2 component (dihydrolipoamide acetyltransferase)
MARPVRMPPLGTTENELTIVQWLKEVGSTVAQGEILLEVETDKATLDVEAAVSGTLLAVLHGEGAVVGVGEVLGYVGEPGEEIPAAEPSGAAPGAKKQAVPVARKLAQEHGIDLATVDGSGPGGRIEKQDVLALIETAPLPDGELEVTRHRRALAERLTRSIRTIPQFSVGVDVDMSRSAEQLARERAAGLAGLTYTHLVLRAAAAALREHPALNRLWVDEGPRIRQLESTDLGLAVAGDDSLFVTVIAAPDRLELAALVEATAVAEARARDGRVNGAAAALTLSNLGMFGVDRFQAIVDPDQTAILAVGAVRDRASGGAGEIARTVPFVELTLSVDHRVVDGVPAARFLAAVRERLESGS